MGLAQRQPVNHAQRQAHRDRQIRVSRLIREWQGVTHVVTVQPDGFDYDGQRYKSLSKVANTITGKHWNGFAFFGLGRARKGGA